MNAMTPPIVLASASPRRQEMLRTLGISFRVVEPNIIEDWHPRAGARSVAMRLAEEKIRVLASGHELVVAMDTVVAMGALKLGKPADASEAKQMLRRLSGRSHRVITGVAMQYRNRRVVDAEETRVQFRRLSKAEIDWYVGTGEPQDKAGGYGIQGFGKILILGIHGCYFNVVGFPIQCFIRCVNRLGFSIFEFMDPVL